MLTFGFYNSLRSRVVNPYVCGVTKPYVWVLYSLRLGVVNAYVWVL